MRSLWYIYSIICICISFKIFKFCIVANFPIVHYAKMNTQNVVYLTWKFITKINFQTSLSQKWLKRGPNNKQNGVSRYQSKQIPSERNLSIVTLMKEIYHDYKYFIMCSFFIIIFERDGSHACEIIRISTEINFYCF